jgi:hypothetical protein
VPDRKKTKKGINTMKKTKKSKNSTIFSLKQSQQILKDQIITKEQPGSILMDFNMLLNYIGEKGMQTGGKYGFFPMGKLAEINSKLTHTIRLSSIRPQQKAFPHIHGLYLLLRSTGITYLKMIGKKRYLLIDEMTFQSWNSLNSTEQYFTLLEAWLLQGNEEIIQEKEKGFPNLMARCCKFFDHFYKDNFLIPAQKKDEFQYFPGWYNIALLQMFGFIRIKTSQQHIDTFWLIDQIQYTDFGKVMIPFLKADIFESDFVLKSVWGNEFQFGEWQSLLHPYFPEWNNNLIMKAPEFQEGVHIFKVSIYSVWRRIAISGNQELEELSDAILNAFDFDDDHLYQFTYKNRKGISVEVYAPYFDEDPSTTEVRIGEIGLNPGDALFYLYDFGDQWEFTLILEKIDKKNKKIAAPVILESYGESPEQYKCDDDYFEFE